MKRTPRRGLIALVLLAAAGAALVATPQPTQRSVADLLPAGPLLALEAQDFSSLVRDWNASPEKRIWLRGDNFRSFSRSRLFLRLKEAQEEFATAAGFPPDMALVESVAGSESALALYGIGKLEFLYITRLPAARAMQSVLWQLRGTFEPRQSAGLAYYVREEEKTERMVGFAATDDYLFLATRGDLLAKALALLAGRKGETATQEAWYRHAVQAAGSRGELRLVMNIEKIIRTPHFRSYWIHGNQQDLRSYAAGIADLRRTESELREERVFLSKLGEDAVNSKTGSEAAAQEKENAVRDVLRLVPESAGLFRAWAQPPRERVMDLFRRKLFGLDDRTAGRSTTISAKGSTDNLELRIDQPPRVVRTGGYAPDKLSQILDRAGLEAALHLQSSRAVAGQVFVRNDSALVLRGKTGWNESEVCQALATAIDSLWTTAGLGTRCKKDEARGHAHHKLDGLKPLLVAVRENYLVVSNHVELLAAVLDRLSAEPPAEGGEYVAGFRHARERIDMDRMLRLLDHPWANESSAYGGRREKQPQFFSDNLGSLSRTLARVEAVTIVQRRRAELTYQTIKYHLSR